MVVFFEVDVEDFIELMERETQARRRVAEIIERRRRMQSRGELEPRDDQETRH